MAGLLALLLLVQDPPRLIYETIDGNAAEVYTSLQDKFKDLPEILDEVDWAGGGNLDEVRKALALIEEPLRICHRAVRMKQCRWDHPGLKALDGDIPHIRVAISASRLLLIRARVRLDAGELDAAVDDLLAVYRIGSDVLQDPLPVSNLVGCVSISLTHEVWLTALANRRISQDLLRRLDAHLAALLARFPTLVPAYRTEKAIMLAAVDRIVADFPSVVSIMEGIPKGPSPKKDGQIAQLGAMLSAEPELSRKLLQRKIEECYDNILHDAAQPFHVKERRHTPDAIQEDIKKRFAAWALTGKDKAAGLVIAVDTAVFLVSAAASDRNRSRMEESRLILEMHRFRCRTEIDRDGYPEVAEGLPIDPYTGKPMKYARIVEPQQEAFVVTREGPAADWEERIRFLSRESRFDLADYEKRGRDAMKMTSTTLWARRLR